MVISESKEKLFKLIMNICNPKYVYSMDIEDCRNRINMMGPDEVDGLTVRFSKVYAVVSKLRMSGVGTNISIVGEERKWGNRSDFFVKIESLYPQASRFMFNCSSIDGGNIYVEVDEIFERCGLDIRGLNIEMQSSYTCDTILLHLYDFAMGTEENDILIFNEGNIERLFKRAYGGYWETANGLYESIGRRLGGININFGELNAVAYKLIIELTRNGSLTGELKELCILLRRTIDMMYVLNVSHDEFGNNMWEQLLSLARSYVSSNGDNGEVAKMIELLGEIRTLVKTISIDKAKAK